MAQKQQRSVDPLRAKASEMRLAQQRAERRTRIIVISAVGLIVLAIIAAVGGVIWQQQSEVSAARNVEPSDVLGVYADGRPIVVNGNGVSAEPDPNLPTLTEYFDYSCHACADVDAALGEDLTTWASEGHYNLELQPVITVNMNYLKPATGASLVVAQKAPDKWIEFHHALLAYFRTQFQAGNGTVVQNLAPRGSRSSRSRPRLAFPLTWSRPSRSTPLSPTSKPPRMHGRTHSTAVVSPTSSAPPSSSRITRAL